MLRQAVIVTGAGSGIGLSIVEKLLSKSGSTFVIAIDINETFLQPLTTKSRGRLEVVVGDVSQRATSEQAVDVAINRTGRVDCLVLNAGVILGTGRVAQMDIEECKRLFDVNFFAVLHTMQCAIPSLRKSNGRIIMTSSGVSLRPEQGWGGYASTKSGLNYLCSILHREEPDITAVCITPGIVDTGMQDYTLEHKDDLPTETYLTLSTLRKEGRMLKPEQPAASFAAVALKGIPDGIEGKVVPWDDSELQALW